MKRGAQGKSFKVDVVRLRNAINRSGKSAGAVMSRYGIL